MACKINDHKKPHQHEAAFGREQISGEDEHVNRIHSDDDEDQEQTSQQPVRRFYACLAA